MTTIERLKKKYGARVVSEGFYYNPFLGRSIETFKVYSADGCCWDKGFTTLKSVEAMCKNDAEALLEIKAYADEIRAKSRARRVNEG